jgi:hypothetical protein
MFIQELPHSLANQFHILVVVRSERALLICPFFLDHRAYHALFVTGVIIYGVFSVN